MSLPKVSNELVDKMAGCCTQPAAEPQTLVEQLKAERARVSRKFTARIRELDQAIRLLEGSDAETILRDAQSTLYKEI